MFVNKMIMALAYVAVLTSEIDDVKTGAEKQDFKLFPVLIVSHRLCISNQICQIKT